ncbi:MAG: membrane dipeptidase [Clostridia bacterium]|nr:membrane dipeptidase [Clostridia bacterium]
MTQEQQKAIYDIVVNYWTSDDPDLKAIALAYNAEATEQARRVHKECLIVDGCTFYLDGYNWQLEQSGAACLNMTIPSVFDPSIGGLVKEACDILDVVRKDPEHFVNILKVEDIYAAHESGRIGILFGAQNCDFMLCRDLEAMTELVERLGLRVMQIGYNTRSFAADGCVSGTDAGITTQGRALIRAMENHGITVDLAHVGRLSTLEAMDMATKPMIFSHANPKALFDHCRNITDEQIKKCASIGGVMGACAYSPILYDGEHIPSIERFVDAICYYADLVGVDHVGIGLDSDAQPGAYIHHDAHNLARKGSPAFEASYLAGRGKASANTDGILSLANHLNIVDKLLRRGFSEEEVKKIMGGNFIRVFKQTWKA